MLSKQMHKHPEIGNGILQAYKLIRYVIVHLADNLVTDIQDFIQIMRFIFLSWLRRIVSNKTLEVRPCLSHRACAGVKN